MRLSQMEVFDSLRWIFWPLAVCCALVAFVNGAGMGQLTKASPRHEHVCSSKDIRNHVNLLDVLENCTVIEGHLHLVLIEHAVSSQYQAKQFPMLREITDYLLLYRVYGLKTLSHIFPNLSVIRGKQLFYNYALVAFEVPDLEELGLAGLTAIVRGAVRLEKNQNLCYIDTIDWSRIVNPNEDNFIVENKDIDECVDFCPKECKDVGGRGRCWTSDKCQKICDSKCGQRGCYEQVGSNGQSAKRCCHSQCLGGCHGPTDRDCYACAKIFHNGRCQEKCPNGTYRYFERRCITEAECRATDENHPWKVLENPGRCEEKCPIEYTQTKDGSDPHKCVPCQGACPKVCTGLVIDNVAAAQKLKGCTEIHGILEISIKGGTQVEAELEKYLGSIEVVTKYIRIMQSSAISTINFFKSLRSIDGDALFNGYALFVLDNHNLQDIWDFKTHPPLTIGTGKVFFQYNRKLCVNKIEHFVKMVGLENVTTETDVSPSNNGDLIACNMTHINISTFRLKANYAIIRWSNFHTNDNRELLSWVVNYREAPKQNITMFDARDACGTNVWKTDDVSPDPDPNSDSIAHIIFGLQPNTQYAVYVQTYTISSAKRGALSPIIYFTTMPDIPTAPQDIKVDVPRLGELKVSWSPPSHPNGNVTHYYVRWRAQKLVAEKFALRDYCEDPLQGNAKKEAEEAEKEAEIEAEKNRQEEALHNDTMVPASQCCTCPKTEKQRQIDEEERQLQIEFENFLQNHVYRTRPMTNDGFGKRRRKRQSESFASQLAFSGNYSHLFNDSSFIINMTAVPNITLEEREEEEFEFVIVYHKQEALLTGLSHFTDYSIEVIACQDYQPQQFDKLCSQRAIASSRTLPHAESDLIHAANMSVQNHTFANNTNSLHFRWAEPPNPNGLILSYDIEVKPNGVAEIKSTQYCLTQKRYREMSHGYYLIGLPHGHYGFRVRCTSLAGSGEWSDYIWFYVKSEEIKDAQLWWVVVMVVATCIAVISVVLGTCLYFQRKSNNVPDNAAYTSVNPDYVGFTEVYVPDEWEVDSSKVELVREIGQGSFGKVYEGIAHDIAQEDMEPEFHGKIRVAIKTVVETSSIKERVDFLNEASVMKAFRSYHVLRLLGVVSKTQPTYVIMEFMENGDLKTFLRMHRPDYEEGNQRQPPTVGQLLQMAGEIADGMAYLAAKKFVHRDLAARNCMVNDNFVVKIGDFGMTRDIYDSDYYRKQGKGCLPVRWMAPESLSVGTYTSQSDVWSYGVVLWEMATLASQPYQIMTNEEVLKFVINRNTMDIPENTPEKLAKLMQLCWEYHHQNRPTFCQIIEYLENDLNDSFREKSFYHNESENLIPVSDDEGETRFDDWDDDEDEVGVGTPLTGGSPLHAPPESMSDTRSTLSYDSRKPSPAGTPNNQNSYLLTAEGDAPRTHLPPVLPRTMLPGKVQPPASSSGYSSSNSQGPSPAYSTDPPPPPPPLVLKDTAHLWQRPASPARGSSVANNHSYGFSPSSQSNAQQKNGTTDRRYSDHNCSGSGSDHCNNVDNSRDSSKSSGGSGGRNGITNGHIPHMVPSAHC